jgi:hypothetical protein
MQKSTLEGRNPAVVHVAQFFESAHLPSPLREIATDMHDLAEHMIIEIKDSPMLTTGLHRLLEAKDALVRAKLAEVNAAAGAVAGAPISSPPVSTSPVSHPAASSTPE